MLDNMKEIIESAAAALSRTQPAISDILIVGCKRMSFLDTNYLNLLRYITNHLHGWLEV